MVKKLLKFVGELGFQSLSKENADDLTAPNKVTEKLIFWSWELSHGFGISVEWNCQIRVIMISALQCEPYPFKMVDDGGLNLSLPLYQRKT